MKLATKKQAAKKIKAARLAMGYSMRDAQEKSDMSTSTISQSESGEKYMKLETLDKLAKLYKVGVEELIFN